MGQMRVELLDIDDDAVVAEASQIRDASQCHGRPHAVGSARRTSPAAGSHGRSTVLAQVAAPFDEAERHPNVRFATRHGYAVGLSWMERRGSEVRHSVARWVPPAAQRQTSRDNAQPHRLDISQPELQRRVPHGSVGMGERATSTLSGFQAAAVSRTRQSVLALRRETPTPPQHAFTTAETVLAAAPICRAVSRTATRAGRSTRIWTATASPTGPANARDRAFDRVAAAVSASPRSPGPVMNRWPLASNS